ncbi:MAG: phosphatase PAP2 family protein [Methylococcaceae bacterium]|nr:phosphatase PAP2 family protein [Methylococcaceae bacterium]MDD1616913.1 phosphatase PAP2 family protein [Methylococcaceae bacterium]OYV16492.1 MAG: phosphoesterase PA-phosphatase-like protein [Methylococcaceae bacterium NSP1-2]
MKLLYSIHKYDVYLFTWLVNIKINTPLTKVSRTLSKTADGPLYVLLAALLCKYQGFESPFLHAILLAFLIERPTYFVLKNSFKRNRPAAALENFVSVIIPADKFSFPSGHTSAAFMMATLISYFSQPFADLSLVFLLYGWAALIGFSRVILGVHFPTDTLMGAVLGISSALFSLEMLGL